MLSFHDDQQNRSLLSFPPSHVPYFGPIVRTLHRKRRRCEREGRPLWLWCAQYNSMGATRDRLAV